MAYPVDNWKELVAEIFDQYFDSVCVIRKTPNTPEEFLYIPKFGDWFEPIESVLREHFNEDVDGVQECYFVFKWYSVYYKLDFLYFNETREYDFDSAKMNIVNRIEKPITTIMVTYE